MPDLIPPTTTTPAPTASNVTYSGLTGFTEAAVKEASRHTWNMADRLDPHTFQLLANLAVDEDRT